MQQKLITFAVPCYNSAAYMRHCIETLLSAGEQAEIILVDDGSVKDDTPAIRRRLAALEQDIARREEELRAFENRMVGFASDYVRLCELDEEKTEKKKEIDSLFSLWEETAMRLKNAERDVHAGRPAAEPGK